MTFTNGHSFMQTPVKLPAIYETEQPGPVVVHCVACRSRAFRQDDTLACIMCGREIAQILERRPPTIARWYEGDDPKRGRPRDGVKRATAANRVPSMLCIGGCGTLVAARNPTRACRKCAARVMRQVAS